MARTVQLFIDPVCPFAWITSRWLLSACEVRPGTSARFSLMSLAALNEGRDLDPGYAEALVQAWKPARLALTIQERESQEAFAAFYTAWGTRFHVEDRRDDAHAVAVEALAEAGLDASLIRAWDDAALDPAIRAEQALVEDMVGSEVGTPVISFGEGVAYFGPVITPAPRGEDAGRLLDGLEALASVDGFFELKRARTSAVDFS